MACNIAAMKIEFEITGDGSHTLFVPILNEHYHSTHGAVQESNHVYIEAGLKQCLKPEIELLEIGFGTGLNAFLTCLEGGRSGKKINYTALELHPLRIEEARKLNYVSRTAPGKEELFLQLHRVSWGGWEAIDTWFTLRKLLRNAAEHAAFAFAETFDVVYFDAFAPDKQPEMWSQEVFEALFRVCNRGAVLTTYCAKGSVRRMLQRAGFTVERLPGPPGKREMLRGRKGI